MSRARIADGGVVDEAGEANAIRDAEPSRGRLQFEKRYLASLRRVERPADDICAHVERLREPGDRLEKYVVALPYGEGGEEADADDVAAAGGKAREAIQIELRAARREARQVDGIPDGLNRRQCAAQRQKIIP